MTRRYAVPVAGEFDGASLRDPGPVGRVARNWFTGAFGSKEIYPVTEHFPTPAAVKSGLSGSIAAGSESSPVALTGGHDLQVRVESYTTVRLHRGADGSTVVEYAAVRNLEHLVKFSDELVWVEVVSANRGVARVVER